MVLCDREIENALKAGHLIINPPPVDDQYTTSAVDLTCDGDFRRWKPLGGSGLSVTIDPDDPGHNYNALANQYQEPVPKDSDGSVVLRRGDLFLCLTIEWVEFPEIHGLAGRVEGRSTLARYGVGIHVTAPTIHSGFRGQITLEITNQGQIPIRLRKGSRICQLVVEQVFGTPERRMAGAFQDQASVAGGGKA